MMKETKLLSLYYKNCPSFSQIIYQFKQYILDYDHLATRTFEINKMHNFFSNDYRLEADKYFFPKHNACAVWYSNKQQVIPRVFLSSYLNPIFDSHLDPSFHKKIQNFILNPSQKISYDFYKQIHNQNQYLAWTLLFQNKINHVALRVNNAEEVLNLLQKCNYPIHNPENPLQISHDKRLIQFSTIADKIPYNFSDGTYEVPYAFVEFIERKKSPITYEIKEGFEMENADNIFNSTKK